MVLCKEPSSNKSTGASALRTIFLAPLYSLMHGVSSAARLEFVTFAPPCGNTLLSGQRLRLFACKGGACHAALLKDKTRKPSLTANLPVCLLTIIPYWMSHWILVEGLLAGVGWRRKTASMWHQQLPERAPQGSDQVHRRGTQLEGCAVPVGSYQAPVSGYPALWSN